MSEPEGEVSPGFVSAEEELEQAIRDLSLAESPTASQTPEESVPSDSRAIVPLSAGVINFTQSVTIPGYIGQGWILDLPRENSLRHLIQLENTLRNRYQAGTRRAELRFYTVWKLSSPVRELELRGLHTGPDSTAYAAIITANSTSFTGLRFRRGCAMQLPPKTYRSKPEKRSLESPRKNRVQTASKMLLQTSRETICWPC